MLPRRTMLVGGLLATFAMSSPVGSAMAWTPAGDETLLGSVTTTTPNGASLTCDLDLTSTLDAGPSNSGVVTGGAVTNCVSSLPNCRVEETLQSLPWSVSGTGVSSGAGTVTLTGVEIDREWSGEGCLFDGMQLTYGGTVAGDYDGAGTLSFSRASGLAISASNSPVYPAGTPLALDGALFAADMPLLD